MPDKESRSRAAGRPAGRKRSAFASVFITIGRALAVLLTTVLIVAVFLVAVCVWADGLRPGNCSLFQAWCSSKR